MASVTGTPSERSTGESADPCAFDRERDHIHRRMLSSVSHDLKTPLVSIIGSLEICERLQDTLSHEKQLALIRVALQEAHRLDAFMTNILDMAKLENGLVSVRSEPTDIGAMLQNCILSLSARLQDSQVSIGALDAVNGKVDPVLLSRVVCLVLDNAIKYGGTPSVIHVECRKDKNREGVICIHDKGRGIPPAQMESIFSKYTRLTGEDQHAAGTGLGLAISREIMRLMGGSITVENPADGGALFMLHFPV